MKNSLVFRATCVLLILTAPSLFGTEAETSNSLVNPQLFSALHWRLIGPFRGGRVLTVAGISSQPNTYYFGAVGGGVWKTTDGGRVWKPIFDQMPTSSIGAIAIAPSNPAVIYVGTGEADMRSDITYGDGVYKSTDGGATWKNIGLQNTQQIGSIFVDPKNPDIVLVAALGHPYGPNPERGVFRTTDGGTTWNKVLYKNEDTGAIDFTTDPDNSLLIFATLWQSRRPPWSTYPPLGGPGSGLYKSVDGGATWELVAGHGLPTQNLGRMGVAVAAGTGGRRVYAIVAAEKKSGLYRSDDGGGNWSLVSTDPRIHGRGWYFGTVFTDPKNPDTVYIPNVSLYRSTDGGKSFTAIKGAPGGDDYHFLWIDPADPTRMILGCDQGASISVDHGDTWTSWNNQPTGQFYHVITDNQFPYYVYGSQQDSGTAAVASRSDHGRITIRDWYSVGGGESGYIAPDPSNPNIVYAGDTYGDLFRFDKETGQTHKIAPWPETAFMKGINRRKYRFTWTSPLVFSPQDPHVLYMGSQYLLKTTDQGKSWQQVSPDLTGSRAVDAAGPLTAGNAKDRGYGVIYTIAPSATTAGLIWVGTDTGLIQVTRDGGKTWAEVTPQHLAPFSKISMIDPSHFAPATAYAAIDRHRLDDYKPYIFRTQDYGKTWQQLGEGIPLGAYVRSVREDPVRKGLLFAGTEKGVYVSFDDGDYWQSLQLNLPQSPIHDLAIKNNDLVVATHGRAFWILDDIAPLRELDQQIARSEAHLFQPSEAFRLRRDISRDTPFPPETPAGQNPPDGTMIDYYVQAPARLVVLEIYDSASKLVRRFTTNATAPNPEQPPAMANLWLETPQRLTNNPGLNRFVWDLRFPPPESFEHSYDTYGIPGNTAPEPLGPYVLPGQYEVRLTVAGKTYHRPLTVKLDPRVHVAEQDLAEQLKLALDVGHSLAEATQLHREIKAVVSQLQAVLAPSNDRSAPLQSMAAQVQRGVTEILESSTQNNLLDALHTLMRLATSLEASDSAPTKQDNEVFAEAQQTLRTTKVEWTKLQQNQLGSLNQILRSQGLPEIKPTAAPVALPQ